jgi:hypothetical protein
MNLRRDVVVEKGDGGLEVDTTRRRMSRNCLNEDVGEGEEESGERKLENLTVELKARRVAWQV